MNCAAGNKGQSRLLRWTLASAWNFLAAGLIAEALSWPWPQVAWIDPARASVLQRLLVRLIVGCLIQVAAFWVCRVAFGMLQPPRRAMSIDPNVPQVVAVLVLAITSRTAGRSITQWLVCVSLVAVLLSIELSFGHPCWVLDSGTDARLPLLLFDAQTFVHPLLLPLSLTGAFCLVGLRPPLRDWTRQRPRPLVWFAAMALGWLASRCLQMFYLTTSLLGLGAASPRQGAGVVWLVLLAMTCVSACVDAIAFWLPFLLFGRLPSSELTEGGPATPLADRADRATV